MPTFRKFGLISQRAVHDARGAVTVEFALSIIPLILFVGMAIDLSNVINQKRDVNRLATQISLAAAACPSSDCVRKAIDDINQRRQSILLNLQTMTIGMAEFQVKGTAYPVTTGTMTYLPADLQTEAKRVLEDNDVGIAVYIDAYPKSYFWGFDWAKSLNGLKLRGLSVSLRVKNTDII